mmetsp:Transcript_6180/g.24751  ORF Transcript_6180/g.24751 Transcript_6180/m.24751 type:complete len:219 (-) Transcript_6180:466-1122(-)
MILSACFLAPSASVWLTLSQSLMRMTPRGTDRGVTSASRKRNICRLLKTNQRLRHVLICSPWLDSQPLSSGSFQYSMWSPSSFIPRPALLLPLSRVARPRPLRATGLAGAGEAAPPLAPAELELELASASRRCSWRASLASSSARARASASSLSVLGAAPPPPSCGPLPSSSHSCRHAEVSASSRPCVVRESLLRRTARCCDGSASDFTQKQKTSSFG